MAGNQDIKENRATYELVMAMLKWGTLASALVAALVIVLISG